MAVNPGIDDVKGRLMDRYTLDADGQPVLEPNLMKWALWMDTADRHVDNTSIGKVRVSTVFLGMDSSVVGPRAFYESMIFGGSLDSETVRYATREDAVDGHKELVAVVTAAADD